MKDWQTTLGGILGAIGGSITAFSTQVTDGTHIYVLVGSIMTAVGIFFVGKQAADKAGKNGDGINPGNNGDGI